MNGAYTWSYTKDLGCGNNSITGSITCNPSVRLTEFTPTTCLQKWSYSIGITCGSATLTFHEGDCTNDNPGLMHFNFNLAGCPIPDLCCLPACDDCVYEWRVRTVSSSEGWYYVGSCSDPRQCTGGSNDCRNLPLGIPCINPASCPPFGLKQVNEPIDESCIVSNDSGDASVGPSRVISYYCADDGSGGRSCNSCSTWGTLVSNCPSSTTLYSTPEACAANCS
jgi:hypothetical protein